MQQEKIGNFIAQCRKKKNLTQSQLAEKLNLSDKSISKWETGKGMPDSSIMLELCNCLEISVNELLSGEYLREEQKQEKNNEKSIKEDKRTKKEKSKIIVIIVSSIFCLVVMLTLNVIYNSFFKPINYITDSDYLYDIAIEHFKERYSDSYKSEENWQVFCTYKGFGISDDGKYKYAYMCIKGESYYVKDNKLCSGSAGVKTYRFTFKDDEILKYEGMKDGAESKISIRELFPKDLKKEILEFDTTVLDREQQEKVEDYYSYLDSSNMENKYFVRTYHILNITESHDGEHLYLTIRKYQAEGVETIKVSKKLTNNIKVNKPYEFTFQYKHKDFDDTNIKSILENATIISIVETDKLGMDQRQEPIQ